MVARIFAGIVVGIVVGEALGARAEPLLLIGTVILDLIKGLAGPLILFAVLDAFLKTNIPARSAWLMIGISSVNAVIAIAIGLTLSNIFRPGLSFESSFGSNSAVESGEIRKLSGLVAPDRKIDFVRDVVALIPTSIIRPVVDNAITSIVILAIFIGMALRKVKAEQLIRGDTGFQAIEDGIAAVYRALEVLLGWVVTLVPFAVFGVVARTIGLYGFRPFRGLIAYVAVAVAGLLIQVLVVYQAWLLADARMPLREFWSGAREAIATAIGTGSSLATLPVTLRSLDRMGVSRQASRMAACVGTNLNNDGILLYEAMAVLFVAQAIGHPMNLGQQALASAACVIAGIGISGVPDAGLISLLVVLRTVMPDAAIETVVPFLLSVDWFLGRCRSTTNVLSDMIVAVLLDRLGPVDPEGKSMRPDDSSSNEID